MTDDPAIDHHDGPQPQLCRGLSIEYKAFVRVIYPGTRAAIVCVLANCYFKHTGFTIFFESSPDGGLALMQSLAPGHFHRVDSACAAGWCYGFAVEDPPGAIDVTDSYGTRRIIVHAW
jgi:hypothetical protein